MLDLSVSSSVAVSTSNASIEYKWHAATGQTAGLGECLSVKLHY